MLAVSRKSSFEVTAEYWRNLINQQAEGYQLLAKTQARYNKTFPSKISNPAGLYAEHNITNQAGAWHCSAQGSREYQEDRTHSFQMHTSVSVNGNVALLAINRFFEKLTAHLRTLPESSTQGACCALAVTLANEIIVGSLGDCQVELLTRSKADQNLSCMLLTPQHQVELEKERIEAAGLSVKKWGVSRVEEWNMIMLSGALGDFKNGDDVFRRQPSITILPLDEDDEQILLGLSSDGIFAENIITPEDFAKIYHQQLSKAPQQDLSSNPDSWMPQLIRKIDQTANYRQANSDNRSTILRYFPTIGPGSALTFSVDVVIDGHNGFIVAEAIKKVCQPIFEEAFQEAFANAEQIDSLATQTPPLYLDRANLGLMQVIAPKESIATTAQKKTWGGLAFAQSASLTRWQLHALQLIAYREQRARRWFGGSRDPLDECNQAVNRLITLLQTVDPDTNAIERQMDSMKAYNHYSALYYLTCCLIILFWNYTIQLPDIFNDIRLDLTQQAGNVSMAIS